MNATRWKSLVLGMLAAALLAGGCSKVAGVMVKRTISVTAAEDVCRKSVEVHLVGVNWSEKDRWENMSMTDY